MVKRIAGNNFPKAFSVTRGKRTVEYQRVAGLCAVHGEVPAGNRDAIELDLDGGAVSVCRGTPAALARHTSAPVTPVYRLAPHGPLAVPTGAVFVRVAGGETVRDHLEKIEGAGFLIERQPAFARHTAWVRPRSGAIAEGLRLVSRLRRLRGIVSAEPQLLMRAARKGRARRERDPVSRSGRRSK